MRIPVTAINGLILLVSFVYRQEPVKIDYPERWPHRIGPPCYGSCPAYSVAVKGTGEVTYVGTSNVILTGEHHSQIPKRSVEALLAAFRQANYFSLKDNYSLMVTDNPTYKTSIEFDGQKNSVHDYVGWRIGMPEVVTDLEDSIDRIVGTEKWIKGESPK